MINGRKKKQLINSILNSESKTNIVKLTIIVGSYREINVF